MDLARKNIDKENNKNETQEQSEMVIEEVPEDESSEVSLASFCTNVRGRRGCAKVRGQEGHEEEEKDVTKTKKGDVREAR